MEYNNIHGGKLSIENLRLYLEMSRGKQVRSGLIQFSPNCSLQMICTEKSDGVSEICTSSGERQTVQRDQLVDCSQFEGCGSCHGLRSPLLRGNKESNKVITWSLQGLGTSGRGLFAETSQNKVTWGEKGTSATWTDFGILPSL